MLLKKVSRRGALVHGGLDPGQIHVVAEAGGQQKRRLIAVAVRQTGLDEGQHAVVQIAASPVGALKNALDHGQFRGGLEAGVCGCERHDGVEERVRTTNVAVPDGVGRERHPVILRFSCNGKTNLKILKIFENQKTNSI